MIDDALIATGCEVKALGDGKIGGYLVAFTGPDATDLDGEYFTAQTDFDAQPGDRVTVYYNHGLDPTLKRRKLGTGVIAIDDAGIWAETQLQLRDAYERAIYSMAEAGKLGWSSGSLAHLVEKAPDGGILSWPLGKDASLTPTPAAGPVLTAVQPLKFWATTVSPLEVAEQGAGDAPEDTAKAVTPPLTHSIEEPMSIDSQTMTLDPRIDQLVVTVGELANTVKTLAEGPVKTPGFQVSDEADRALAGNPFKTLGEMLVAVRNSAFGNTDKRLLPLKAILGGNESVSSEGGYLVATAQDPGIERKVWDSGVFVNRAQRRELPAGSNSMDFYGVQEDTRAAGYRWGGVTGYRVAEGGPITASGTLKFYKYTLKPKKYAAVIYLTDEVLNDARVLEQEIMAALPNELAFMVDDDMYRGGGANGCFGILNSPALITVDKENGQSATTIVYENLVKMWARRYARGSYAWFVNQDVSPQLDVMAHAVGTAGIAPRFVNYDAQGAMSIYGAPVIVNEFSNTLGTVGDIVLADWSQYKVATIGGVNGASSPHVQFLTDQMCYRFTWRVDGQPTWKNDLTPFQGTNTVSPFIALATRS